MPTTQINLTGQALSKTDDTNVTLTLGGTPLTALLKATSLTLGWTGTLADARITSAATWNAKESALTFSTGLTRTVNTITIDSSVVTLTGAQALSNKTGNISQWTNDSGYLTSLSGAVTSVSGTASRISSTGGATPIIDISASYVGQTSITTLGTIGTGTWQGTVVGKTYGGTGVSILTTALALGTASSVAGQLTLQNATNAFTQTIRGTNPAASITYDLPTTAPTAGQVLQSTAPAAGIATLSWATPAGGAAISALTLATATNTIDNTNYAQEWQWSTLAAGNGLKLSSTSTVAASNTQTLFNIALSGANGTAAQTTYGLQVSNTHTGTTSTNIAGYFAASGGATRNWALYTSGSATVGTPNASDVTSANGLQVEGSLQLLELASRRRLSIILNGSNEVQYQSINSGLYFVDTGANPIRFGTSNAETARIIGYNINIGNGTTNSSAGSGVISVTGGSLTNNAGGSLTLAGGKSTGSAAGGSLLFQTSTTLGSGTTAQTLVTRLTLSGGAVTTDASTATWVDALDFVFGSTTGTKIGTATTQKIGFWNKTPIVQPTTAIAGATVSHVGGAAMGENDTIGGYTLAQVVQALQNIGILA